MDDLARLDETARAALVCEGKVTTGELVGAATSRMKRSTPALNAVEAAMFEEARGGCVAPTSAGSRIPHDLVPSEGNGAGRRIVGTHACSYVRPARNAARHEKPFPSDRGYAEEYGILGRVHARNEGPKQRRYESTVVRRRGLGGHRYDKPGAFS